MKRSMGGAVLFAAMVALAPADVDAQVGPRGARVLGPPLRGGGVELILSQRKGLELTDDQVTQLDQIRQEAVRRRTEHQGQMAELRSKVRSGQESPATLLEQVQARRQVALAMQEAQRTQVESILNDAQKEELQDWVGQGWAFRMGRRSAAWGGPGFGPGAWAGPGRQQWGPGVVGPRGGGAIIRRGPGAGWWLRASPDSIPPQ